MKGKFTYWDIEGSVGNNTWAAGLEGIEKLIASDNRDFQGLYLPQGTGRGFNVKDHAIFDPIAARVPMSSLCDLLYSLAHFDREYFDIIDYGVSATPFEYECFIGQFFGVDIRDATNRKGLGWAKERRNISIYVRLPSNSRWNAFGCIDRMLDNSPRPPGKPLRHFLYLLSKFGWFSGDHDFNIEATVKRRDRVPDYIAYFGGSLRNGDRDEVWDLEQVTASVGCWQFIQYPSSIRSVNAGRLASLGYKDQIEIKKFGTKGMEQIHLFLSGGTLEPGYTLHRSEELEGIIGGDTWTEKELRLAEMLELRSEIFLDKPEQFPILYGIQHLTPERLRSVEQVYIPRRREEILSRFGEGTIKFPKMEK